MSERDPWEGIGEWDPFATHPVKESVRTGAGTIRVGDRVRLAPKGNADIMDIALRGKTAVIESIEADFEDAVHLAVPTAPTPAPALAPYPPPTHPFSSK